MKGPQPNLLVDALELLESTCHDLAECGLAAVHLVSRLATSCRQTLDPATADDGDGALHLSESLRLLADDKLNSYPFHAVPPCWRRLYTDAVLYGAIAVLLSLVAPETEALQSAAAAAPLLHAIGKLDLAIVVAGTPGPARHELALSLITHAQERLVTRSISTNEPLPSTNDAERPAKRPRTRTTSPSPAPSSAQEPPACNSSAPEVRKRGAADAGAAPPPYIHLALTELAELPTFLDPVHNPSHREPFIVRRGAAHFPVFDPTTTDNDDDDSCDDENDYDDEEDGERGRRRRSRWSDLEYLRRVAGPGRVVPVEVGGDYTQEGWGQRIMPFDEFLDSLRAVDGAVSAREGSGGGSDSGPAGDPDRDRDRDGHEPVVFDGSGTDRREEPAPPPPPPPLYYLAQHSLFRQFPALLSDLLIPDLVYSPPEQQLLMTPRHSSSASAGLASADETRQGEEEGGEALQIPNPPRAYEGPGTEEGYVLNAWLGPRGTKSAAHTDPWWNCYVQVAGSKWIWVAPPECASAMRAFGERGDGDDDDDADDDEMAREPVAGGTAAAKANASEYMTNTSSLDVTVSPPPLASSSPDDSTLSPCRPYPARFLQDVVPHARQAVLQEGDVLVMPPGWWHAMVGLETSFSVSMWF
ncbi:hypothetical protein JCM3774_000009 [Rhodotorula dairenensis]